MSRRRVSIKDIAAAAGVSHPTVSRALRGQGRMSEATRARILSIAQEMGYTPNLVARGLVTQRTHSVGLVVTDVRDPFHSEIIRGVEAVVRAHGYSLFLASTTADPDQELEVVRSFIGRNVDGIIIASSQVGDRYGEILDELGMPIVLINSHAEGNNIHAVRHDDYAGASAVMAHLLDQGFRRIAFLGLGRAGRVHGERRRAWEDALRAQGLAPAVSIQAADNTIQDGFQAVQGLLEQARAHWGTPPEAIFCYNDLLAIGAISGLRAHGLDVPRDVAVAGFDDLEVCAHMRPSLTTLRQPRYEMGEDAARLLLALLEQDPHARPRPKEKRYRGELQIRESTQRNVPS